jgi:hypothetical protein
MRSSQRHKHPVLLNATREHINELGRAEGVGVQDFVEAAKISPGGVWASGICENAEEISRSSLPGIREGARTSGRGLD